MNTILKTLVTTAATPFAYTMGLLKPQKKEAPPKEEKKEDDAEKDPLAAALEKAKDQEKNYINYNEHDVEVYFEERDAFYQIRFKKWAIKESDGDTAPLITSLKENRKMLEITINDVYRSLLADIQADLDYNEMHDKIKKGELKPEDDKQKAKFAEILEDGPRNYGDSPKDKEWHEKYIRPATQNALLARVNIDILIPLITIRGGRVAFQGLEADPIDVHIESERNRAAEQAFAKLKPPKKEEKTDQWTMEEYFTAAIVVIIIALALKLFI
jgi:pyruvate/2-oxoacid:ferredoxin oxidoreductase alpha subunit